MDEIEVTDAMLRAGAAALAAHHIIMSDFAVFEDIYRAMAAAAPRREAVSPDKSLTWAAVELSKAIFPSLSDYQKRRRAEEQLLSFAAEIERRCKP